jgi:YD repeat-containing protein
MNRFLALALMVSIWTNLSGQDAVPLFPVPSPNASSLGKFDKIPLNHFTGLPNIAVPIYEVTYRDLKLPIGLNYHPSSIKPDQQVDWTGLGWSLAAGGAITRQIKGNIEDEHAINGFFKKYAKFNVADWGSTEKLRSYSISPEDFSADVFQFNINGHSGEIIMSHTGSWVVNSEQSVKVIFDPLNDIMFYAGRNMIKRFILVTSDGTKYTFGGSIDFIEYSYSYLNNTIVRMASAWLVSKIESPSSKAVINFTYARGTGSGLEGNIICSMTKSVFYEKGIAKSGGGIISSACQSSLMSNLVVSFQLHSPLYLKEIVYSDFKIEFHRSASGALQYPSTEIGTELSKMGANVPTEIRALQEDVELVKSVKLDSISIKANNQYVKSYELNYNNGSIVSTQRLALTELREKGKSNQYSSSYRFSYHNLNLLPEFNSHRTDHWGYYKNTVTQPTSLNSPFYKSDRNPNAQYTTYGVLNKITYPTKGYVSFEWESHDYSLSVPADRTAPLINHSSRVIAGGPRIKGITFFNSDGTTTLEKKLFYVKGYTSTANVANLASSGILAGQIEYKWNGFQSLSSDYSTLTYDYGSTNNQIPLYDYLNGSHVGYSEVIEVTGLGNGYTVFKYTNFDNGHGDEAFVNTLNISTSPYFEYSSKELERGKLIGEYVFKDNDLPVQSIEYEYSDPAGTYSHLRFVSMDFKNICSEVPITLATAYKKYYYKYLVSKKTEKKFDQTLANLQTETFYSYNSYAQLREERQVNLSKGETRIIKTKYATDYNLAICFDRLTICRDDCTENSEDRDQLDACVSGCDIQYTNCINGLNNSANIKPLLEMVNNHMISIPIERSEFVNKGGPDRIVKSTIDLYKYHHANQLIIRDAQYSLELNISGNPTFAESGITVVPGYTLTKDSKYVVENTFNLFDAYGNLNEVTDRKGLTSVQLWSYDYRYPVIQVTNSSYADVIAVLGSNSILLTSSQVSDTDLLLISTSLRNALPKARIITSTYSPVYGVTSQSDSNGQIVTFEYDDFGRLKLTRDAEGKIVKQFIYNYKD